MLKYKKSNCSFLLIKGRKRAQVGETVSWIIATLIIIALLIIFIYLSILISKGKVVRVGGVETDIGEGGLLKEKTLLAYRISDYKDKEVIEDILEENDK